MEPFKHMFESIPFLLVRYRLLDRSLWPSLKSSFETNFGASSGRTVGAELTQNGALGLRVATLGHPALAAEHAFMYPNQRRRIQLYSPVFRCIHCVRAPRVHTVL